MDKVLEDRYFELGESTESVMGGNMPSVNTMLHTMEAANFLIETKKVKDVQLAATWFIRNKEKAAQSLGIYETNKNDEESLNNAALDMLKVHFCKQHLLIEFNINPEDSEAVNKAQNKRKKIFGIF